MTRKLQGLRAPCMRGPRTRSRRRGGAGRKEREDWEWEWEMDVCDMFRHGGLTLIRTRIHEERWLSIAENGV